MAVHLLNESDWNILREIVQKYRQTQSLGINRQPSLPNDIQDILTPEDYIARTPTTGIPKLTQSSSLGTGAPPPSQDPDRPGFAYCYVYRILEDDFGVDRLYPIGQPPKKVYNFLNVAIPGNAWITISRDKFGKWKIPSQGFNFRSCDEPIPGTGTTPGTSTSGGDANDCFSGLCGDTGVHTTLFATITNKVGCCVTYPDILEFSCVNQPFGDANVHTYDSNSFIDDCTSTTATLSLHAYIYSGTTVTDSTPVLTTPTNSGIPPESGWTCKPFSAVYLIDLGAAGSCTITIVS